MSFLALDTSGKELLVAAKGERLSLVREECALKHSVTLFPAIDRALSEAGLSLPSLGYLACAVGPGSFTGIRIGISAVKGMCLAAGLPALAVTSFEALAYAEEGGKKLALVDAGHGFYYGCPFEETTPSAEPKYMPEEEALVLISAGYVPIAAEELPIGAKKVDALKGLARAAEERAKFAAPASELSALYLRKSAAEEGRK